MKILAIALLFAPTMTLAACPPVPDRSAEQSALMAQIRDTTSEADAQVINNQLWKIWTTAPDDIAQEILQSGMERRRVYDLAGATEAFDRLIAYCPDYSEGYNQRAFVHFIREAYDLSLADLERTLEITPDHIGAASGKALSLINMGRELEGQIALRHALTLHPWLSERALLKPLEDVTPKGQETDL